MNKEDYKYIGRRVIREDAADKVRGAYDYLADSLPQDTLVGVPLLSSQPNALVKNIDASEAEKIEGVVVLTFRDAPENKYNSGEWFPGQNDFRDESILTGHARHVGDRIALVLADDEKTARRALSKIKVEYEPLPAVADIEKAEEMAHFLHEDGEKSFPGKLRYGDVEAAFAAAAHIESDVVCTQKIHHAALEPHCVLAIPRPEKVIELHTPCQIIFGVQHAVAQVLPLPLSKIRVVKANMGGTFGGKQECVFEPLCAWAAWKLRRPVFITTDRGARPRHYGARRRRAHHRPQIRNTHGRRRLSYRDEKSHDGDGQESFAPLQGAGVELRGARGAHLHDSGRSVPRLRLAADTHDNGDTHGPHVPQARPRPPALPP